MFRNILDGVKVVDFTHVGAGPMCTMLLGDMGADILKVEPRGGELGRKLGPGWIGEDCTAYYGFNRNKRSIAIDLKSGRGREIAQKMAADADVVVESLRPGAMRKLGLDYETLKQGHDALIYCSISAYGQQGPYAARPGVDGILQADSGLMSIIGHQNVPEPCKVQAPVVDVTTGYIAALAVMAKLLERSKGGTGGHIDVNLLNAAMVLQQTSITNYLSEGAVPERMGSAAPYSAPNEAFQTRDGWIMVAAYNGSRWEDLCGVLERPELAADPRFATSSDRVVNRQAMQALLTQSFIEADTAHWLARLMQADILCAKVSDYVDLEQHPQANANGMFTGFEHPVFGAIRTVGFPINSAQSNASPHTLPPACGEHSAQILAEHGYSHDDIEALYAGNTVY
jgi:crotonobetainyl-CoA:carnitine CoA-transferase CaiB-like acyl-CoA transferase